MTQQPQRFKGRSVLITAAGGNGTGGELARRFLAEGADVVASDINEEGLERLRDVPLADGQRLVVQPCDVSDEQQVEQLVTTAVDELGRLDVVCNHAGGGPNGRVVDLKPTAWRKQIDVSLTSTFLVSHFALPSLIESQGCIINTASISGLGGDFGMSSYNAAKAGVVNLTRAMAIELGAQGVRVNSVAPGPIFYEGSDAVFTPIQDVYLERVPLGRFAAPSEIASAMMFLASPDASYITGHCLTVDGGMSVSSGQVPLLPTWEKVGINMG